MKNAETQNDQLFILKRKVQKKMTSEEKYITSDLYLTAYLKVKGHKFSVEKVRAKSNFVFECTEIVISDVNDYLSENGSCEPLAYANSIKNLKNYLYNQK